ncbi:hypothetical protein V6N13_127882 [Hibiscus sabdariffa]|uniref:RING-CH-type domain-containing protein n=1 Tax=Hibiscus sabdariffa TaxID=183260 RepID=A0ABR2CE19_9ROSI
MPPASKAEIFEHSSNRMEGNADSPPRKLVECRICHDEDEDSNMEIPCSCCGSLKYAHRKCVQRWCNVKGDTICEICQQQYTPGYIAPPPLFHYGGDPLNFGGNWEISDRDLRGPHFIAMVTTDHDFLESDFDDYLTPSSQSVICCRVVAIIFTALLVLRHALPIMTGGTGDDSSALFTFVLLKTIAILLPICIMVRAFTVAIQRRRRRQHQDPRFSLAASDEESDLPQPQLQAQSRIINVH